MGDCLLLVGENPDNLGQSAFFREVLKIKAEKSGPVPIINFQNEIKISEFIFKINSRRAGTISSTIFKIKRTKEGDGDARAAHDPLVVLVVDMP